VPRTNCWQKCWRANGDDAAALEGAGARAALRSCRIPSITGRSRKMGRKKTQPHDGRGAAPALRIRQRAGNFRAPPPTHTGGMRAHSRSIVRSTLRVEFALEFLLRFRGVIDSLTESASQNKPFVQTQREFRAIRAKLLALSAQRLSHAVGEGMRTPNSRSDAAEHASGVRRWSLLSFARGSNP